MATCPRNKPDITGVSVSTGQRSHAALSAGLISESIWRLFLRQILVVANQTLGGEQLKQAVRDRIAGMRALSECGATVDGELPVTTVSARDRIAT